MRTALFTALLSTLGAAASPGAGPSGTWDYRCVALPHAYEGSAPPPLVDQITDQLNQLGRDRWELVAIDKGIFCLKRPSAAR